MGMDWPNGVQGAWMSIGEGYGEQRGFAGDDGSEREESGFGDLGGGADW
jgi:hypothetical protein